MIGSTTFILAYLLFIGSNFVFVLGYRDNIHPLVVDYNDAYNYVHLKDKMIESLSINMCTMDGDVVDGDVTQKPADLHVKVIPPSSQVIKKWGPESYYKSQTRIFAQVSPNLCSSGRFKDLKKGFYKRAKGCYKVYWPDKNGKMVKRFNDYGATLHPEHIRCDNTAAIGICESGSTGMQVVSNKFRNMYNYPFLITAENVIVPRGGMFALPCGPFGLFSSCEAVKWGVPLAANEVANVTRCRNNKGQDCPYTIVDRVFIMTQYDDTQIGQFMQEALPKLVYHLEFLRKNPDIKIHYGFTKQPRIPDFVLPHHFFEALGLKDRLINGNFFARQIYMPREGGCQDIGYNAWEAVSMREKFLQLAGIREDIQFKTKSSPFSVKPSVLVLTRSPGEFTQNKADYKTRGWPQDQFPAFLESLKINFPSHDIEIFSDQNKTLMTCPLCQAAAFNRADVVIGMHGAGLSNAIFMKPGGVMVEVVYDFDSRHAPIIGIFPRMSEIVGLHHYTVYVKDEVLKAPNHNMVKLANDVAEFTRKAKLWA